MCGIVGYIGDKQAQPILLKCLARLEYRGYDSCGIAVMDTGISVYKDAVRVESLARAAPLFDGMVGIGHTRWATHGVPSEVNAHPHCDCSGNISVVHNGIIANFEELKKQLIGEGHIFVSDTDTEVIPHLVEKYDRGNLEEAVQKALADIEGSYAIIVMKAGEEGLVVARKDSPLIVGVSDGEHFVASDVPAVLDHTNRVIYLEDGDCGVVSRNRVVIRHDGAEVKREEHKVSWSAEDAEKSGYEHFMLKEIHEQPKVIRDTLGGYIAMSQLMPDFGSLGDRKGLLILACGTSFHAALVGKYVMEDLLHIPVRVELASEFSYSSSPPSENTAIVITQSGETADTLRAMKKLRRAGCLVLAITNVAGSTAARLADHTVYTRAGLEISVAATKSFTAQLIVMYWLAISHARLDAALLANLMLELRQLPGKVQRVLSNEKWIADCAHRLSDYRDLFLIGRGVNFPVALEGALKVKEVSYVHAEGYAGGELKHGPFALLGKNTPVVAILAADGTYQAMLTNIKEIKARGSPLVALAPEGDEVVSQLADHVIQLPRVDGLFSPVVNSVALQLLAYYIARDRNCPVDFPRNLAKSVTVE